MSEAEQKVALVTGASRGIGRAIALRLAKDGAKVVLVARNEEKLAAVAKEITDAGGSALVKPCDMSDAAAVKDLVKGTAKELGRLDVLVNNAGITRDNLVMRMKDQEWDDVLNVNLKAVFVACREATRPMLRARRGRIVNITSIVGLIGNAGQVNYASAKAAIVGLTKSLAKELGSRGVTVNAVAPGYIETDMTSELGEDIKKSLLDRVPLGCLGQSDDIAATVSFLASDEARYITGEVIRVDGGLAM
ncbi:MAG: 3-oxoacyl-[acyl-carrier-protein] reductase [Planctomycetota bacterium]|nr:3-oxoacyl-[acyl-carrier-protein] reductase [Planctomycetota bacterium]